MLAGDVYRICIILCIAKLLSTVEELVLGNYVLILSRNNLFTLHLCIGTINRNIRLKSSSIIYFRRAIFFIIKANL